MESFSNQNNIQKPLETQVDNVEKPLEKGITISPLSLKEKLLDKLEPVFNSIGISAYGDLWEKTTEEITNRYTSIEDFSNEAGDFFEELIPQGLNKPEVIGEGRHDFTTNVLVNKEKKEFIPHHLSRKVLRENLINFSKESLFREERKPYQTELKELPNADFSVKNGVNVIENGRNSQEVTRAMNQSGSENIIYEHIKNDIYYRDDSRRTEANLIIQDIKSGVALDLNALLPKGFHFEPGIEDLDLKTYGGASSSEGRFFALKSSLGQRFVGYGNVTKKGNTLSLFHEIAHAWQANYSEDITKGKYTYKKLVEESYRLMSSLDRASEYLHLAKVAENENLTKEYTERVYSILSELSDMGTDLIEENNELIFWSAEPVDKEGVINLQYSFNNDTVETLLEDGMSQELAEAVFERRRYYPIKNSKLEKAREEFITEERDAWAHALRMMRFLRQKGLDVEPEFKKLADIKKHIDPCLGSYQKGLEMDIKLSTDDYRFSRIQ